MAQLKEGSTIKGPSSNSLIATYNRFALSSSQGVLLVEMDPLYSLYSLTPTGNCTINADGGVSGQRATFDINTNGTPYVVTFGTNFKSQGTLSTGSVASKTFIVDFICKGGGVWAEVSRTVAI